MWRPGPWIFAWPLAKIIAVLPVSLNGLGLREATLAGFLAPFGASAAGGRGRRAGLAGCVVYSGRVWRAGSDHVRDAVQRPGKFPKGRVQVTDVSRPQWRQA